MYSIEHKNAVISILTADKRRNHIIEQFGQKQIPFEFLMHLRLLSDLRFIFTALPSKCQSHIKAHGRREGMFDEPLHAMEKCVDDNLALYFYF